MSATVLWVRQRTQEVPVQRMARLSQVKREQIGAENKPAGDLDGAAVGLRFFACR
jgi:hypothetical protein